MESLDAESEQIKEVYARYGLAVYQAQCVERQLAFLAAIGYGPKAPKITRSQFEQLLDSLYKKTFGGIFSHLRRTFKLKSDFETRLRGAVDKRNWLVHEYFWERAGHFMTQSGRTMMIAELQEAVESLDALDHQLIEISRDWARKNGITEELLQIEMQKLIESVAGGDGV